MRERNKPQHPTTKIRSRLGVRLILTGIMVVIAAGSSVLPDKGRMEFLSTRHVEAQTPSQSVSGKLATDGTPPENLQATPPNYVLSSPGRQVSIDFNELPIYTEVRHQYPDVSFSTDSTDYVISTPQNYGTSLPNISRVSRYGYWINGVPPYNHFAPLVLDFPQPVNDLGFHMLANDSLGVVAQVAVYQNFRYTRTEPIYGYGNKFVPIWLNLAGAGFNNGAGYSNVTRIEFDQIADAFGLAFDNFGFTVPNPTPTPTPTPLPSPSPTPPAAPTNLKATPDEERITLSWTPSASATSYTLKRSSASASSASQGSSPSGISSSTPIATITCTAGVPCTFYPDPGLSSDLTYTYTVSATNFTGSSGDSMPASGTPLPKPGCEWKNSLQSPPNNGNPIHKDWLGWSLNYSYSAQEGLVVSDVYLNGRKMANRLSVPYYKITTRNAANPNAPLVAERGELKPNGSSRSDGKLFSRLIKVTVEPRADELFIEADYGIDNIPGAPNSCLKISQIYDFFKSGFEVPHDPNLEGPCEPSGTITTCTKFRPLVTYSFHGGDGESLSSINIPERLQFQVRDNNEKPNTVVLTRDKDTWRTLDGLANFYPFAIAHNPVLYEGIFKVVKPGLGNKDFGSVDNFHQTNHDVFAPPIVHLRWIEPGCPECVHMHWRWSKQVTQQPFAPPSGAGHPLVFPGSTQSLDIAVVVYRPGYEEHPDDYGPLSSGEPIANEGGNKPRRDVVLWYSPHGFSDTDTFFWNPSWFNFTDPTATSSAIEPLSNGSNTPATVQDGPVSVTFGDVYQRGTTTFTSFDLSTVGPLPPGYAPLNNAGYGINTTAIVSGPHTIDFRAASVTDQNTFNNLRVFQLQPDAFDPEKEIWVDCTILPPATPAPDFSAKTLSARSQGLGIVAIGQLVQIIPPDPAVADLSASCVDSADPIIADNNLTYTATVTNNGPQTATEVALMDGVHADVNLVSFTPSQGTCRFFEGRIICSLGTIPVSGTVTVTIVVKPTERSGSFPTEGAVIYNAVTVRAKQTDSNSDNNSVAQTTTVLPNPNKAPEVSIMTPTNAALFTGPAEITINASAADTDGSITKVQFAYDDHFIGEGVSTGNNQWVITAHNVPFGPHTLIAVASDNGGRFGVSEPITITVNGLASVNITSPTAGGFFSPGSNISLVANASHPSAAISKVEFFANGEPLGEGVTTGNNQYSLSWNGVGANLYSIVAVATDSSGATTTSTPTMITVDTPPTVTINTPSEGAVFPPDTNISLSATAQSAVTSIAKVDFYANGIPVATASDIATDKYTATWRHIAEGFYTLTAVATDSFGVVTTSAPVHVAVNNVPVSGQLVWFDDALPAGATPLGDREDWQWVTANPGALSGTKSHQSRAFPANGPAGANFHQHFFLGATARLPVNAGDKLFTYVFLDINNLPREIMLQWYDGNNWDHRARWGENNINVCVGSGNACRYMGTVPKAGQWVRLEVPAEAVGLQNTNVSGMAFSLDGGRATWDLTGKANVPPPTSNDFVWVEDTVPAGSISETIDDQWLWLPPHYSGTQGHRSIFTDHGTDVRKFRAHSFRNASTTMTVQPGDVLFTYVFLDASNMPEEIMLQWQDSAGWEHRAFWGQDLNEAGVTGTEGRRYMGGMPPSERWVRLEVPASYVGLEGKVVTGMSFGFFSEHDHAGINWDFSGKSPHATEIPILLSATTAVYEHLNGNNGVTYATNANYPAPQRLSFYLYPNQTPGTVPLYRYRRPDGGSAEKFYSRSLSYLNNGWVLDSAATDNGIAGYVYADPSTPGAVPLYLYHDNRTHYFLTTNQNEANSHPPVDSSTWAYVFSVNPQVPAPPTSLRAVGCYINWLDNSATEAGSKVERADPNSESWSQVATTEANHPGYCFVGNCPEEQGMCVTSLDYKFRVRAYNGFGNSAYSNVERTQPETYGPQFSPELEESSVPFVSIAVPANGALVERSFSIFANAFDIEGNGTISKVEFFADGVKLGEVGDAPYEFFWLNAAQGVHSLTARVTDNTDAHTISSPVNVTVGSAPTVIITSPANNSTFTSGSTIQIAASAADVDGTISKVEIYEGTTLLGQAAGGAGSYSFNWNNVAGGTYTLTARATDNSGFLTTSAPLSVSVTNPPPSIFADDFNDNSLDANKWTIFYPQSTPPVTEQSQQLQVTLAANTAGYNGVYSNSTFDLTGRMAQVEVVQAVSQAGWVENYLSLELDPQNSFLIDTGANSIVFRARVNGVNDQTVLTYDATAHRHWRVRHDQSANTINFETSADGTIWTTRKTVTPGFALTSLRFYLMAGAWGTGNGSPGVVKYDNFKLVASTPGGSSGSFPNAGFESPAVGYGNFQAAPSGGIWSFAGGAGVSGNNSAFTNGNPAAPEGNQVAFLQGGAGSVISQTIAGFQPDTTYRIIFSAAQRGNCCGASQDFQLYLDGTLLATFRPTGSSYSDYSTTVFTVPQGAHLLKFIGLNSAGGDNTAFIDNVRITAVGPTPVFYDDFNENSIAGSTEDEQTSQGAPIRFGPPVEIDTLKWTIVDVNSPAVVTEESQQLRIALPPHTAAYNGVASKDVYDMQGKMVEVEVVQPVSQAGWCENFIKVESDERNYYLIDMGGSSIVFRSTVNGVNDQLVISYDQSAFRYWRIRHNSVTNTVSFETSNNDTNWTTRKQVAAAFSLKQVRFYLYAGAWGTGNNSPGAAKYDNFQLVDSP